MKQYNIHEAKTHLSKLVEDAANGEDIILAKNGKPIARLTSLAVVNEPRKPGALVNRASLKPGFDEPLPPGFMIDFSSGTGDTNSSRRMN